MLQAGSSWAVPKLSQNKDAVRKESIQKQLWHYGQTAPNAFTNRFWDMPFSAHASLNISETETTL